LDLQLHGHKFDSCEVNKHFYTLLTSRVNCHNCQNPLTSDLKVKKMLNKGVSLRNCPVSSFYSSIERNLTSLTLNNTLLFSLRHVTTVKTHSSVTWQYKMTNMCIFFGYLHCKLCLQLHGSKFDSWVVKEYSITLFASRDKCQNVK